MQYSKAVTDRLEAARQLYKRADQENRELTDEERGEVEAALDAVTAEKSIRNLDRAGPPETRIDGNVAGTGWAGLAKAIDVKAGKRSASVAGETLLRKAIQLTEFIDGTEPVRGGFISAAADRRRLYPYLNMQSVTRELAVNEFKQTGTRDVTGEIERDPLSTSDKAELDVSVEAVTEDLKQLAVLVSDVPNAVLEAEPVLRSWLQAEMQLALDKQLDEHVLAQIVASGPPGNIVGADLIAQIRNGVAAMRAAGANPTVLVLNPEDGVALDLDERGADGLLTFPIRDTGQSSPLFGLQIVEVAAVDSPILLDPALLGRLYIGPARLEADPYSGFSKNLTTLRLEHTALFHVRDVAGVYEIMAS